MKRLFTKNKNHSRMFLSEISSLVKAVETPDTNTRGWNKVLGNNTSARQLKSVALKGCCSGPLPLHNREVLSKDTSARHIEKYVALSTVIPQCRSAGYNVVFFPAIPRTETLRGDEAGRICR